jgi:Na+-transporting methylmalonyl-CoA/oxaloacetate decarboxylase gamma subunit
MSYMPFGESLLIALFLMAVVFVALFALYLFVTLTSLIVETSQHAAKRKKAAH